MSWRKRAGFFVLAALIIGALLVGFMPQPILVEGDVVERGPLAVTVEEEGKTRVIDRFVVSAPVAGYVRRITLDVGDSVRQQHLLAELEPLPSQVLDPRSRAEAEARVAAAQSALRATEEKARVAKADADLAAIDLARMRRLYKAKSISRENVDQAEAKARSTRAAKRSAEFDVEVARFELDAARTALQHWAAQNQHRAANTTSLERVAITAPVNGQVLKVHQESEGVVDAGQPLLEIGNPRALEVEIDVLSIDAVRIKPGTPVRFVRWGGDVALEGVVRVVEPAGFTKISSLGVEEQRVLVIADIVSPPEKWQRLGDGYRVEASFLLWSQDDILQIPNSALFRVGAQWAVFTVENGRAKRRSVQVGQRNGLQAQVIAGLAQGNKVITHPSDTIRDGARVRLHSR